MKVSVSNQRPIGLSEIKTKSLDPIDKVNLAKLSKQSALSSQNETKIVAPYSAVMAQQLSHAQSALQYSQQLFHALASYEKVLTQTQTGQLKFPNPQLDKAKAQIESLWGQRLLKTQQTLDYQGKFHLSGKVKRPFSIRGIELNQIHQGAGETLLLMKQGIKPTAVVVGGGQERQQLLHALRIAFAPSHIQIQQDQMGQLQFLTQEKQLPHLKQELLIRGGGHRVPAGQIQTVDITPEPALIAPEKWQIQKLADLRTTLTQVLHAKAQLGKSYRYIHQTIEKAKQHLKDLDKFSETRWATAFVTDFHQSLQLNTLSYHTYQELYAASNGIRRQQVKDILKS